VRSKQEYANFTKTKVYLFAPLSELIDVSVFICGAPPACRVLLSSAADYQPLTTETLKKDLDRKTSTSRCVEVRSNDWITPEVQASMH